MTIRKNFTMQDEIAHELEVLSTELGKTQSQLIQELIHERAKQEEKRRKQEALKRMSGRFSGVVGEDVSIQSIKAQSEL
jgi:predicted DNA-binding protein